MGENPRDFQLLAWWCLVLSMMSPILTQRISGSLSFHWPHRFKRGLPISVSLALELSCQQAMRHRDIDNACLALQVIHGVRLSPSGCPSLWRFCAEPNVGWWILLKSRPRHPDQASNLRLNNQSCGPTVTGQRSGQRMQLIPGVAKYHMLWLAL